MDALEKAQGDALAKRLIQEYWTTLTGGGHTWLFYYWPLYYTPYDRWATRDDWINAARKCLDRDSDMPFALGILLDEGFGEYLDNAMEVVAKWEPEWEAFQADCLEYIAEHKYRPLEPEDVYDLIKHFPHDHPIRHKYLPVGDPDALYDDARQALIRVEDEDFCRNLSACIERVFTASNVDSNQVEEYALPRMMEIGRPCSKYISPAVMNSAKQFCLDYLERDRQIAPRFRRLSKEMTEESPRILWIRDRIAPLAWRIGWLDILTALMDEPWYWNKEACYWNRRYDDRIMERDDLLVWSQYLDNDTLRKQALHVMRTDTIRPIEGAIAWVRMSDARWPPE